MVLEMPEAPADSVPEAVDHVHTLQNSLESINLGQECEKQGATPSTQAPALPATEYAWTFAAPRNRSNRAIVFTKTDNWYFDNPHSMQRVAMRFRCPVDPALMCRGLYDAIVEFPKVGSKIITQGGERMFDLDSERITLQLIRVSPELLAAPAYWQRVCDRYRKPPGADQAPLFQAFLLRCSDWTQGCVLIACFDHVLGDGASYAMFMRRWSSGYMKAKAQQLEREGGANTYAVMTEVPPDVFPDDSIRISTCTKVCMRWLVSQERLDATKRMIQAQCGTDLLVTANHILMAEAAIALAPTRRQIDDESKYARIPVLADHRGRGCPQTWFGNGVVDVNAFVPWGVLEREDVAAAAAEICQCVRRELQLLETDLDEFEKGRGEISRRAKLFCWNSWSNATRVMIEGDFGEDLLDVEWLNTHSVADTGVVLSFRAVAPTGSIVMQVADFSPSEIERLSRFWGEPRARPIVPRE